MDMKGSGDGLTFVEIVFFAGVALFGFVGVHECLMDLAEMV